MRAITIALALVSLGVANAQLTDLQPGRNFDDVVSFPGGVTESVDLGDVDNDGDLDIVFGNGGDLGPRENRIFINMGGLQGGTTGAFVDETALRFAGLTVDTTRDLDFGDIDGDGDLDIVEATRGGNTVGQPSRIHINQGGLQSGTLGYFVEATDTAWGTLATVDPVDQVLGGDAGPFLSWSCDCDFADLDDDGDLDLFASSYGPQMNGQRPSRVFLNDGTGVFNEHAPWADALADITMHSINIEVVDLDGDFDLDIVAANRDSQSRVFVNNTHSPLAGATTLFTDTTQRTLLDVGSAQAGTATYDLEFGDVDLDGDFDAWAVNYQNFSERLLINDGGAAGTAPKLIKDDHAILGDPISHEVEADFFDFDNDGDLDVSMATFSGTNSIFVGGHAQGLASFHRSGTTQQGSLYPALEVASTSNNQTTRDTDVGDLDGDGDTDIAIGNDNNASNYVWFNTLGVPDTHAPTFAAITPGSAVSLAGDVVIHAAIRDNDAIYNVGRSDVDLVVSIDGAPAQHVDMIHSGSAVFRGALDLGAGVASLSYHIEATDVAGNTAISATLAAGSDWTDLGGGLAGIDGIPSLTATGSLAPLGTGTVALSNAAPSAPLLLVVSPPTVGVAFKGGTLLAFPLDVAIPLTTSPTGTLTLPYTTPTGIPSGTPFHVQLLIADDAAIKDIALTNGLRGDVP